MLATLLAFGIDPKRSVVFYQEDVSIRFLTVLPSIDDAGSESVPYRSFLDFELYNSHRAITENDDLEGVCSLCNHKTIS